MAFENFLFADPVPAQQAVQYAQLKAQEQAQRNQVLRDIAQQGIAQQTALANQAMTRAQMNQQMSEAEKARQARGAKSNQLKFQSVASIIDSDDPPTDSEFKRLAEGLDDDSILQLKTALNQNRNALKAIAEKAKATADYWNSIFDDVKVGEDDKFSLLKAKFVEWEKVEKDSRNLIERDPRYPMRFVPKYKGPRLDAPALPATGAVPSPVTPIGDLLSTNPANVKQPGGMFNFRIPYGNLGGQNMLTAPITVPIQP